MSHSSTAHHANAAFPGRGGYCDENHVTTLSALSLSIRFHSGQEFYRERLWRHLVFTRIAYGILIQTSSFT